MHKLLATGMVLVLSATASAVSVVGGSFVLDDAELLTTASHPNIVMTDVSGDPGVEFNMGQNEFVTTDTGDLPLGTIPSGLPTGLDWTMTVENTGDRVVQMALISQSGPNWTWRQSDTIDIDPGTTADLLIDDVFDSSDLKALKIRIETRWWSWMGGDSIVTVVPTIPEPAAFTLFGLIAACGLIVRRKRIR